MKRVKRFALLGLMGLAGGLLCTGCTTKYGGIVTKSQFIYPNSNVTPLGPVTYSATKTSFFVPPHWKIEDTKAAYRNALAKAPGATALVDYKEDTTYTSILFFNSTTYSLEGTAIKMEVGKQDISK